MAEVRPTDQRAAPLCRWRTSGETLDVIEALERMESLLVRLDERIAAALDAGRLPSETPEDARPRGGR